MNRILLSIILTVSIAASIRAQQSIGTVQGRIRSVSPEEAEILRVRVEEVMTEARVEETEVDSSGSFTVRNLPFATYDLYLMERNVSVFVRRIVVHSAIP